MINVFNKKLFLFDIYIYNLNGHDNDTSQLPRASIYILSIRPTSEEKTRKEQSIP